MPPVATAHPSTPSSALRGSSTRTLTVYSDLGRPAQRRRLAFLLGLRLSCLARGIRHRLRMWSLRNHERAYLANLTSAEFEHLSRDLGRPMAELQAEAKPWREIKTSTRR
jgi:hypothetical protein